MAVDAYVSMAASQLRDAVSELHDEIQRVQADAYDHEQRVKGELSREDYERTTTQASADAYGMEGDKSKQQNAQNRVQQLNASIHQKQQEVDSQSKSAADAVKKKQSLMNKLQSIASQLEPLIAQARE